ncbi:NADH-quinone oxidoreductase subunit G [Marihabitans asiaticum]|uniref:NADH-quinone oxidoreductase n=1 Tax=Marihabitans asiaticum TaxID=415218 RepID=A0A560WHG8_9MICO|nr:NADH-quinone oxidoreductase subunit G [Marihabitans asiaticum]TWD17143.1 NADH dehydrogenase subunit G [Marihabitans asiaticum]
MTVTSDKSSGEAPEVEMVALTIDGLEVSVPKDTLVIRAAEQLGIQIPRFCDHPGLDPVGACRQCLVEVAMPDREGNVKPMPKPQASCTMTVAPGMEVKTQLTSAVADKAQQGVMELLLVNHPLDCPVCDKGGECPLQNQAMSNGRASSRFEDVKRTYPKPINISSQVLLDRERCILCARCTRFSDQVAGDPFIALVERGALQQVGIYEEQPFESYFSGNTVQICPVGALTGAAYRFRSRPFDLVSTASVCEHCASGCSLRVDHRRGKVMRRMALATPEVNEEWNCDKGRWAFTYPMLDDRFELPMVRRDGELVPVSWQEALAVAADGLRATRSAVLVGGRVGREDAYAYGKLARLALGTNDVDFRARPHSAEEERYLAEHVVGSTPETGGVTYADLDTATTVVLVGFEPEEESPIVFLRLRKAYRKAATKVFSIAPLETRGLDKLGGTLLPSAPGTETEVLQALAGDGTSEHMGSDAFAAARTALRDPGAIVLVGERLATVPGALAAAADLARSASGRVAWVPRRAGERGALDAGTLPSLLPGGRLVADQADRSEIAELWQAETELPTTPGRDTAAILESASIGEIGGLVVGGVDVDDIGHADGHEALRRAFVVSLDLRESTVTPFADVVLPVAPHDESEGSFLDWEGRPRPYRAALDTTAMADHRVLSMLADELGVFLGTRSLREVRAEMDALAPRAPQGGRTDDAGDPPSPVSVPSPGPGEMVLATWRTLLDRGTMQDGEPFLAGTAKAPRAVMSPVSAETLSIVPGDLVTVSGGGVRVTVPVHIQPMVDHVVWLPTNSESCDLRALAGQAGAVVTVTKGGAA